MSMLLTALYLRQMAYAEQKSHHQSANPPWLTIIIIIFMLTVDYNRSIGFMYIISFVGLL